MKIVFIFILLLTWLDLGTGASVARAQDGLEPPAIEALADAPRPAETGAHATEIRLRVTLDAEGQVTDVEVLSAEHEALAEAAREAVARSRFRPARRHGQPIPSRFELVYAFPAEPEPPAEEALPVEEEPAEPGDATAEAPEPSPPEEEAAPDEADLDALPRFGATGTAVTAAEERRRSVEAVDVVELADARQRTADLGEVLARTEGVTVRRSGGLGSQERLSLVGLEGRQIRTFIDGIPAQYMGFGMGIANVPVGLVDRVEIYRGVVPVRYGADAVGGAIDLVSDLETVGSRGTVSYQTGSFGTHRLAANGRVRDARTGFFARGSAYFDHAENDYDVDARVADSRGRIEERRVSLENAEYRSAGVVAEAGLSGRPKARLASIRAFFTDHERHIPHNIVMTVPYGKVRYGHQDVGALLRYENDFFGRKVSVALAAGFVAHRVDFYDRGDCVVDWFGNCVRTLTTPGEMTAGGRNIETLERTTFLRSSFVLRPAEGHAITLSISPSYAARETVREAVATSTLTGRGSDGRLVVGLEHEYTRAPFQNSFFVKSYAQWLSADDRVFGSDVTYHVDQHTFGLGDAFRLELARDVALKASYEWATRLPESDEYFGDGVLTLHNFALRPERSHNANLSLDARYERERFGVLRGDVAFFARRLSNLIWLVAGTDTFNFENVGEARSIGSTASFSYRSPGDWVDVRGNLTYQDFRNITEEGRYADVYGDRVPNRPFFEAAGEATFGKSDLITARDRLSLLWGFRYVHEYFLTYESRGTAGSKVTIPSQFVMHAAVRYVVTRERRTISTVIEAQNLANAVVYDFYGVQRPRRAIYAKLAIDL